MADTSAAQGLPDPWQNRPPRKALRVPVVVHPGRFRQCWLTNLSATGVGLVGVAAPGAPLPSPGAELQLEFTLPDRSTPIRARGQVAWVQPSGGGEVALGLRLSAVPAADRAALAEYVTYDLPRVALVLASAAEQELCRATLRREAVVEVVPPGPLPAVLAELQRLVSRGGLTAVLVFGAREEDAVAAVDAVRSAPGEASGAGLEGPPTLPPVIFCGPASDRTLLQLHNEDKVVETLPPPLDPQPLLRSVRRAIERCVMHRFGRELEQALWRTQGGAARPADTGPLAGIVYASDAMREVLALLRVVAPHRMPALLVGETGTGKELLARAIHGLSERAAAPFVAQDCGALTEALLESELFGHVKGAFTGAISDHAGLFQMAEGGTIFLDEVENTSPSLQAKLLRVIETGEVRPVGGTRSRRVDVRIVAASNRNLEAEVQAGRFRADLYYRLSPFPIEVPPLRERTGDVLLLAREFLRNASAAQGRPPPELTPEAEAALQAHAWPGNVRELRNVIERALLLTPPGEPVDLARLRGRLGGVTPGGEHGPLPLKERLLRFEREVIREALARHGGVLLRAAKELQTHPVTLGRRARQLGLWPPPGA